MGVKHPKLTAVSQHCSQAVAEEVLYESLMGPFVSNSLIFTVSCTRDAHKPFSGQIRPQWKRKMAGRPAELPSFVCKVNEKMKRLFLADTLTLLIPKYRTCLPQNRRVTQAALGNPLAQFPFLAEQCRQQGLQGDSKSMRRSYSISRMAQTRISLGLDCKMAEAQK